MGWFGSFVSTMVKRRGIGVKNLKAGYNISAKFHFNLQKFKKYVEGSQSEGPRYAAAATAWNEKRKALALIEKDIVHIAAEREALAKAGNFLNEMKLYKNRAVIIGVAIAKFGKDDWAATGPGPTIDKLKDLKGLLGHLLKMSKDYNLTFPMLNISGPKVGENIYLLDELDKIIAGLKKAKTGGYNYSIVKNAQKVVKAVIILINKLTQPPKLKPEAIKNMAKTPEVEEFLKQTRLEILNIKETLLILVKQGKYLNYLCPVIEKDGSISKNKCVMGVAKLARAANDMDVAYGRFPR